VLVLTRRGWLLLHERGITATYPRLTEDMFARRMDVSSRTLQHELTVMDVKAALVSEAAKFPGIVISELATWPALYEFRCRLGHHMGYNHGDVIVKPDGFLRIRQETPSGIFEHAAFLEVDRSTESLEVLARRAAAYAEYYRSGGFAARYGATPEQYQAFPFRVLYVFRNPERRNNAAMRFLHNNPPVLRQAWLTTEEEVRVNPFGPVWVTPADHQQAIKGTTFDTPRSQVAAPYRRHVEREATVEQRILKHPLVGGE
jgi:hypothetical protein